MPNGEWAPKMGDAEMDKPLWFQNSMDLKQCLFNIGYMFQKMAHIDFIYGIVTPRPREHHEIAANIRRAMEIYIAVAIHFLITTAKIQLHIRFSS